MYYHTDTSCEMPIENDVKAFLETGTLRGTIAIKL